MRLLALRLAGDAAVDGLVAFEQVEQEETGERRLACRRSVAFGLLGGERGGGETAAAGAVNGP